MRHPSSIYMDLAADGTREEETQLSRPRKAGMFVLMGLLLLFMPLLWASGAQAGGDDAPQAVMSKSGPGHGGDDDDDDDNSGPGSGRDDHDTDTDKNTANTDTGTNTNSNTRTGRDDTLTNTGTNKGTGKETNAKNTDKRGLDTGKSTRGETDPGDKTGKTERR